MINDDGPPKARPRHWCIVDIETRPDRFARILSGQKRLRRSSPLHEVCAAACLDIAPGEGGGFGRIVLASWHHEDFSERDILVNVIDRLERCCSDGGAVVTYNGHRHDIPVLRLRQMRWWLGHDDLLRRLQRDRTAHFDVMREFTGSLSQPPSLKEACAMIGVSLDGPVRAYESGRTPYELQKCQSDVIGTAILLAYLTVSAGGGNDALSMSLGKIGGALRAIENVHPHLARFAASPLLGEGATPWGG